MKFVLIGRGYIGKRFERALVDRDYSVSVVGREDDLVECIEYVAPDFIINAAGYVGRPNVDQCEINRAECLNDNFSLPYRIMRVCEDYGINWGHVSTGCLYQGRRPCGGGWREADRPNFSFSYDMPGKCSFYSGVKGLAEEALSQTDRCYIWRIRMPFTGDVDDERDYLGKVMRYDKLFDVENSLTDLDEFVDTCITCVESGIPFGTYNVTNPGSVTTREVTELLRKLGISKKKFKFYRNEEDFMKNVLAPRSSCVLDTSKLDNHGLGMIPIVDALSRRIELY